MFDIKIQNNKICAIYDKRYTENIDITDGTGRFGWLTYTRRDQNLREQNKPEFQPYNENFAGFDNQISESVLQGEEYQTTLAIESRGERLILDLQCESEEVSAAGIFLPFNFMSRKNGFWKQQFTASSPYHTPDGKHYLYFLARPDGNNLVCIVEHEITGFKIDYSPYLCGHFIRSIEFLSNFDKAYERERLPVNRVRVHIAAVSDYQEALKLAGEIWNMPALYYPCASIFQGQPFRFETFGLWDEIEVTAPSGKRCKSGSAFSATEEYGIYQAVPYRNGKAGIGCHFFVHDKFGDMYARACDTVMQGRNTLIGQADDGNKIYKPTFLFYRGYEDFNLCEHAMWCWSLLGYMALYKVGDLYRKDAENALKIMTDREGVRINCMTYDRKNHYATLGSTRIQEAYNGVNILLSAYKVWKDERLLEFAVRVLQERLSCDLSKEGGIFRHGSDGATVEVADYTTVTGIVIPIVDMALVLKEKGDDRYHFFEETAVRIADYVVRRGLAFPTEGGVHPEVNPEVEEGSMSCSALTVLYVAARIQNKKKYLEFAGDILKIHDAFTVHTAHPVMFRSSLRWWETIWEGDSDGPAVCYGHAWSIWRAEALYWYGILTGDEERLLDSYNGFMSNLAKEDVRGNMYAIYQYEQISSGALAEHGADMDYSNREGFPHRKDSTLSRYVFARAKDTWFETVAVLKNCILGAAVENGVLVPFVPNVKRLFIGDVEGTVKMKTENDLEIFGNPNHADVVKMTDSDKGI